MKRFVISGTEVCRTPAELIVSGLFERVLSQYLLRLSQRNSPRIDFLRTLGLVRGDGLDRDYDMRTLVELFAALLEHSPDEIARQSSEMAFVSEHRSEFYYLVEDLYDYWRKIERFLIFEEDYRSSKEKTRDYHDWFRGTTQDFEGLVRETYRRVANNLTGNLFRVYRQLPSGVGVGLLVETIPWRIPGGVYRMLEDIRFIQLVIIEPPLIYYPKRNYREGQFTPVSFNPLDETEISKDEWFCFPAKVGLLKVYIYFHSDFLPLGVSLANLFELAVGEEEISGGPDCILIFGADGLTGERATIYFEDQDNDIVIGLVSGGEEIDYFGYLKKMTLTLHNITMINRGWFPVHGAMVNIVLRTGKSAGILIVGDTGTGKSESIEAFRTLAEDYISELDIVFDDMGVLGLVEDRVLAFGTETGAFVRLDDLAPGYAYSEVDRSIFMNPQMTNARVVIPVTFYDKVVKGYPVDYFFYANNYEEVDNEHPVIEFYDDARSAIGIFESGSRLAKGTTDERGLVHSYFANPFGAVQKKEKHRDISREFFRRMLESGTAIGQIRTRLGVEGYETSGPEEAAKAIFDTMSS